ncbi:YjeO family protein [Escherichia coli]
MGVPLDITITSALDKEWMIDGRGLTTFCDVLMYLEEDDTRDVGVIMTLPLFFPFLWSCFVAKKRAGLCTPPRWLFSATGSRQFFLRYQFCL